MANMHTNPINARHRSMPFESTDTLAHSDESLRQAHMNTPTRRGIHANRDRLVAGDVAARFLQAVLRGARVHRLLSDEHFSVDGTLIEAWASMKSFRRKGGGDDDAPPGRNAERDFRGERRSNATHASATDGDARRFRKCEEQSSRLCYMGHLLMENANALIVDAALTRASGTAELEAALAMLARRGKGRRVTLGADKAYDVAAFVDALRDLAVTPHIAVDGCVSKLGKRPRPG